MRKSIGVTVNLPTTEEGKALLHTAMAAFNASVLGWAMRRADASADEKLATIESLNGVAPWAEGR